jgi:choline dehydrogenase-like flavoprotein
VLNGRPAPQFYRFRRNGVAGLRGGMALTEEVRHRDRLLGFAVTIHNADDPHDVVYPSEKNLGYTSLKALAKPLLAGEMPDRFGFHLKRAMRHLDNAANVSYRKFVKPRWRAMVVGCRAEQAPNPESRVVLERERDALGMNKVRLDWRLTEQDLDSVRRARQILDREWIFAGAITDENQTECPLNITAAAHHMGTTRMHRDRKAGVVDETCRVHGVNNLYVAGSSVFPTAGWAPPTLTIVALALRLADSLKRSDR